MPIRAPRSPVTPTPHPLHLMHESCIRCVTTIKCPAQKGDIAMPQCPCEAQMGDVVRYLPCSQCNSPALATPSATIAPAAASNLALGPVPGPVRVAPGEAATTGCWMSDLPATTPIVDLVRFARMRRRIEQDRRELKHGLGLDTSRAGPGAAGPTTSPSSPTPDLPHPPAVLDRPPAPPAHDPAASHPFGITLRRLALRRDTWLRGTGGAVPAVTGCRAGPSRPGPARVRCGRRKCAPAGSGAVAFRRPRPRAGRVRPRLRRRR